MKLCIWYDVGFGMCTERPLTYFFTSFETLAQGQYFKDMGQK